MTNQPFVLERFRRWGRILTFRASRTDYLALDGADFALGLAVTWIVGMGRYWDDPRAEPLQKAGLGSIAYIFALTTLLFLVAKAVSPRDVRAFPFLVFVSLTSAPAILYAIPVEMWMSLEAANRVNLWFLLIVAAWRVGLLIHYLLRGCDMGWAKALVAGLMPLTVIFLALVALNLHHVVLNIMGGIREADRSSQDAAYGILITLFVLSLPVFAVTAIAWIRYAALNLLAWRRERR